MIQISQRVRDLVPSATLGMAAKAAELSARGIDIVSFTTGEPDFDTPLHIKEAAKASLDRGFTKYAPSAGILSLRQAIADKLMRDNGLAYSPDEITVACGAKHAIANALLALVDPDDEVVLPAPYWVSYPAQILLAGGVPRIVETTSSRGFKLDPAALRDAVTPRTKVLILNSPANPTGAVYSHDELAAIASVCIERDIAVISDEIYEHLVFDGHQHVSIVAADARMRERTIVVNGVSKSFAMTGWRLGWAAGPREIIAKMTQLTGQQITSATSFVQEAATAALSGSMTDVHRMRAEFERRRNHMFELVKDMPHITCSLPEGTFYLFCDIRAALGRHRHDTPIRDDAVLADMLLTHGHVAVVPGGPFGAPGFMRLSFATSLERIDEGISRIRRVLTEIA